MRHRREFLTLLSAAALAGCRPPPTPRGMTIALVTQETQSDYARALQAGANEAAKEIGGTTLVFQGPPRATVDAQVEVVKALIAQQVDAIAISAIDPLALAAPLQAARAKGIRVIAYDAPVAPAARLAGIIGADPALTGRALFSAAAAAAPDGGEFALLSAEPGDPMQSGMLDAFRAELAAQAAGDAAAQDEARTGSRAAPGRLKLAATASGEDTPDKAYAQALTLIRTYRNLKLLIAATPICHLAACRAIVELGRRGRTAALGPGAPRDLREFVKSGVSAAVLTATPADLGYAAAYAAVAAVRGDRFETGARLRLGRLGAIATRADGTIYLGAARAFTRQTIDSPAARF